MIKVCRLAWMTLGAWVALAGTCQAQVAKCPWLNAATAAGVLGGDVELSVTSSQEVPSTQSQYSAADQRADRVDVTCNFRRKAGDNVYQMQIAVNTLANPHVDFLTYLGRCPSKVDLRAIGNEAVQCLLGADGHTTGPVKEQVMGRVRNRAFVLTIDRAPQLAEQANKITLSEEARNIAEQVAGSLF